MSHKLIMATALGFALTGPALAQSRQGSQGGSGSAAPQRREGRERG